MAKPPSNHNKNVFHGKHSNNGQQQSLAYAHNTTKLEKALKSAPEFHTVIGLAVSEDRRRLAIGYIEKLVERWCENVESRREQEKQASQQPQSQQQQQPRSFASVASGGKSVTKKPNVWQKPPSGVSGISSFKARPAIIPFGSYRLGVEFADSDLDLLVLAPPTVQREDFFQSFKQMLEQDTNFFSVHAIPTAYVPVIKFEILTDENHESQRVKVDLVFARVADATKLVEYHRNKKPDRPHVYYDIDDSDLQDLDEESVRSLNGARVSQIIMELVKKNESTFKTLLRSIRLWAKSRGLYSNILGFLGGVNCAILAAYVCQLYPNASAAEQLFTFFKTFSIWQMKKPVILNGKVEELPPITNVSRQTRAVLLPAWNPAKYPQDAYHTFPIITPAYPSMNSAFNMGVPQFRRIQDEMRRTLQKLSYGNCTYSRVLHSSDFFQRHQKFLQISVSAEKEKDFIEWYRFVETKMRILTKSLESEDLQIWPDAREFKDPSDKLKNIYYMAIRVAPTFVGDFEVDITLLTMDFLNQVNHWTGRRSGMDIDIGIVPSEMTPCRSQDKDENSVSSAETLPSTDDEDEVAPRRRNSPKKIRR